MAEDCLLVAREGDVVTLTLHRPGRRNALGSELIDRLLESVTAVASSDATGVVVAGAGPVFCSGHDLGEMAGRDEAWIRDLLERCTELMLLLGRVPQAVVARVHGLATAAGCQLVAACDLAVAARSAAFAVPGGRGGWFCTTPMVAVGRSLPRKRAFELALTGDAVDAGTAERWGLVNRCVPDEELDAAVAELLSRATRGSAASRAAGKPALSAQLDLPLEEAYQLAVTVMAAASQLDDAQEGMRAFVEKRPPVWGSAAG